MSQFDMEELKTFMRNLIRYEDAYLDAMETRDDSNVPPNPAADQSAHMDRMIKYLADFGMLNADCYTLVSGNKIMRSGLPLPTAAGRDWAFGGGITADKNTVTVNIPADDLKRILKGAITESDLDDMKKKSLLNHVAALSSKGVGTAAQELVKQMVDHSMTHMPSLSELLLPLLHK
nr:hypothetical protein [uncultured Neokomagataea sp.]